MRAIKVFALGAAKEFGSKVAAHLGVPLSRHKEVYFHDGECYVASEENVRGADVYVIKSLYGDEKESVNDKLMKLLIFLGSLHDSKAHRVTVVLPYNCYARQDRKTSSRAPITTKYLTHIFESVFVKGVMTIDAHNPAVFQNSYSKAHFDNLEASGLFAKFISQEIAKDPETFIILSPDEGRLKASRKFRRFLQRYLGYKVGIACVDKIHEDQSIQANGLMCEQGIDIKGKKVIIFDDMISSGKTSLEAINVAREHGAACVEAICATHGLFVGNANEYLDNDFLKNIIVTDTIKPFRLTNRNVIGKLTIIHTHQLFAEAINRTQKGASLSDLIEHNGIPLTFERLSA
jgi:ribose-phosphate pyrophosphokinase